MGEGQTLRNIKLILAYDGTAYHGWQVQAENQKPTVQDRVEKALAVLTRENIRVAGAGRTDAGVHALGQVATFLTGSPIPIERFPAAINSILPDDIVTTKAQEMPPDFHARFSARGKTYRYLIDNRQYPDPFWRNYALHHPYPLDVQAMAKAAGQFTGKFDWRGFCASGSGRKNFVRTIVESHISQEGSRIVFETTGDGFLYNMVRIMAGTLLLVGRGKIEPDGIRDIILSQERNKAGPTVPSHGLYLIKVIY
ncbi:MAG: tRNA pseudouridine(38-40) synthase TruA [Syntrophomonadaceae bacterium]|nr:tRNA pseudouridine(38-40) synthase TruA [Syntrophomonadaceae bacterium]